MHGLSGAGQRSILQILLWLLKKHLITPLRTVFYDLDSSSLTPDIPNNPENALEGDPNNPNDHSNPNSPTRARIKDERDSKRERTRHDHNYQKSIINSVGSENDQKIKFDRFCQTYFNGCYDAAEICWRENMSTTALLKLISVHDPSSTRVMRVSYEMPS